MGLPLREIHMTSRAAKFLSAISASIVVGAPIAATPLRTVDAAVECLATPKGEAPAGQHWSYHFDRDTNRYCLRLRTNRATSSHATRSAPTRRAESHASAALPRATADAHAELPMQQMRFADGAQARPMMPVDPNSVTGPLYPQVANNIKKSFHAFEDKKKTGSDDGKHSGGAQQP